MNDLFHRTHRDGRGHAVYVPTDQLGSDHTHLKIDIYHDKGGTNYWHGTTDPGGYWLSLGAVTVKDNSITETLGFGAESFGRRIHLAPVARFNAKRFEAVVDAVRGQLDGIVARALERNYHGVAAIARTAVAAVLEKKNGGQAAQSAA